MKAWYFSWLLALGPMEDISARENTLNNLNSKQQSSNNHPYTIPVLQIDPYLAWHEQQQQDKQLRLRLAVHQCSQTRKQAIKKALWNFCVKPHRIIVATISASTPKESNA